MNDKIARHLMLRDEVLAAVAQERFHVWTVDHVDEAVPLVVGLAAGERVDGNYPQSSANERIDARLSALHEATVELARQARTPH